MINNDQLLLKRIFQEKKSRMAPNLAESDFFELTVAEQVLKNFNLSIDEIEYGITDGGGDGGIDAIYTLVNGRLFLDNENISLYKKGNISIDLFIIQAKTTNGFESIAVEKLKTTSDRLFKLSDDLHDYKEIYSAKLLQSVNYFRRTQEDDLISKFPKLRIHYVYASLGDIQQLHPTLLQSERDLKQIVIKHFSNCEYSFSFLGAKELLKLVIDRPNAILSLNMLEHIGTAKNAYLCLVNLKDFYKFITDENTDLRGYIFDDNVRSYGGKNEVNKGIKSTLSHREYSEDFWWLNNGITIITSHAAITAKTITLEDPQIVNGMQTSTEIYNYFHETSEASDERALLVRIIQTTDSASQNRIIRATNSQTAISAASLRATDELQRKIETFFLQHDLYYERRKNFYKNQGQRIDKIVSLSYLTQAVLAILLQEPHEARARPSNPLKVDANYSRIFDKAYSLNVYLNCISIMRIADDFIKSDSSDVAVEEKNNLRFYFAMYIALAKLEVTTFYPNDIASLAIKTISDEDFLTNCWNKVVNTFRLTRPSSIGSDNYAKSKDFTQILQNLFPKFRPKARPQQPKK